jgi:hypothetical protein
MKNLMVAAALTFAATAIAADPPAAGAAPADQAPPPPAPELAAAMKVMEGKWKCDGKTFDSPMGKGHAEKGESHTKVDLNGYWYMTRYEGKKTKEDAMPYAMASSAGFDPSKKQLVRTDLDNMGMVSHMSSKGWEGDKIVWTGEVMGPQKMSFKETTTKKSDKEMAIVFEIAGPDGKWGQMMEATCKK